VRTTAMPVDAGEGTLTQERGEGVVGGSWARVGLGCRWICTLGGRDVPTDRRGLAGGQGSVLGGVGAYLERGGAEVVFT
jgi:hypothetical protein